MRYVEAQGVRLSVIGLGTWQFGSREWNYGSAYNEHESVEIVHRAIELGINLIDTAEIYGFGRSERIVGGAIAGRRADVFVATKVFPLAPIAPVVEQRGRASSRRLLARPRCSTTGATGASGNTLVATNTSARRPAIAPPTMRSERPKP